MKGSILEERMEEENFERFEKLFKAGLYNIEDINIREWVLIQYLLRYT